MAGVTYDLDEQIRPSAQRRLTLWFGSLIGFEPDDLRWYFADKGISVTYELTYMESIMGARFGSERVENDMEYRRQLVANALEQGKLDLSVATDVRRLIELAEQGIIESTASRREGAIRRLRELLKPDGFTVSDEGQIYLPDTTRLGDLDLSAIDDPSAVLQQLKAIEKRFHSDPHEAITPMKSLVETSLRLVIKKHLGEEPPGATNTTKLFKKARPVLERLFSDCGVEDRAASLKGAVGAVATLVDTISEIRNAESDGHGALAPKAVDPRLARLLLNSTLLVVNACLDALALPVE